MILSNRRISKLRTLRTQRSYTEWKAVYVDYSDHLQKAQIDNRE